MTQTARGREPAGGDRGELHVSASYRLTGELDGDRLRAALTAVAGRHPILHTAYASRGHGADPAGTNGAHGVGQSARPEVTPRWTRHDLTQLPAQARGLRLEVLTQRDCVTPFDLAAESPVRMTLVRLRASVHVLLVVAHQIAWDDASWSVFLADLTHAYTDPAGYATLPPPPDVTDWTAAIDDGIAVRHWQSVLANMPEPLELPGPNGSVVPQTSRVGLRSRRLPAALLDRLQEFADGARVTPYAVLVSALAALVSRYTHTDDFLIASSVSNRPAGQQSIGCFGTVVLLRAAVSPRATFQELLETTHTTVRDALEHQGGPLDQVVEQLRGDSSHRGANPLARISFGVRDLGGDGFSPDGLCCQRLTVRGRRVRSPLDVVVEFDRAGALVEAEYATEVLDGALVGQMLKHFECLLRCAVHAPDTPICALDLLGEDAAWLDRVSRGEESVSAPRTLAEVVERQVHATPAAIAVTHEGRHYTYRDVNEQANKVAHWLIEQGLGTEDRVAVLLGRSPELVIAALGIAKAGAVYLPVDPDYPASQIDHIVADSAPRLTLRSLAGALDAYPAGNPTDADRVRPLRPGNLAYVVYTSGSTGAPKGVAMTHAPVAEYFAWFGRDYDTDGPETVLQVASTSFDASIEEIFGTLGNGARLVIPRRDGLRDIGYLTELLGREEVTAMHLVPSLLGLFLSLPGASQWRTLRRVPVGGEALPGELADKFHTTFDAVLHNFYGPTETAIAATRYEVAGKQGHRVVPIGSPKVNTSVYVLDPTLAPVPVGAIGEIYIGGTPLARGYLGRPGLTADRFVANPYGAGRLYRTGDLARRNGAGDLEFVGRADEQVKVGGFRIELGEVAAAASVDPSVGQCVVVVRDMPGSGRALVAYMTPSAECDTVDVERVRTRVSAALPAYMTPAAYVVVSTIPITTHGKFDRDALPEPRWPSAPPNQGVSAGVGGRAAELLDAP